MLSLAILLTLSLFFCIWDYCRLLWCVNGLLVRVVCSCCCCLCFHVCNFYNYCLIIDRVVVASLRIERQLFRYRFRIWIANNGELCPAKDIPGRSSSAVVSFASNAYLLPAISFYIARESKRIDTVSTFFFDYWVLLLASILYSAFVFVIREDENEVVVVEEELLVSTALFLIYTPQGLCC